MWLSKEGAVEAEKMIELEKDLGTPRL